MWIKAYDRLTWGFTPSEARMDDHRCFAAISLVINGLIALGTMGAVVVAIWGSWFRSKFMPPRLTIIAHTLEGDPARFASGTRVMFYHLRVIN